MSDIKKQLQISGIAKFVTETEHLDSHRTTFGIGAEALKQQAAKRMHCVIGSIDNLICFGPHAPHSLALGADRRQQALSLLSRVRPTRFAEAVLQNVVGSFQEQYVHSETGF